MATQEQITKGYVLHSALLESTRFGQPIELKNLVTDLEIFEHLDLPYLTANIAVVDNNRLFDRIDIQGHEYLTISISKTSEDDPIDKKFVIDSILSSTKTNEQTEVIIFHLVDADTYKSNLINVNKAYKGNYLKIIENILKENLDLEVKNNCESISENNIKLIVPNMTPLNSVAWIKNRITTKDGLPTYLFKTLANQKLQLVDLNTIMNQDPVNVNTPFLYGLTNHHTELTGFHHVAINSYSLSDADDMYKLIEEGLVGSNYGFYDTMTAQSQEHSFNVSKDAFSKISEQSDQVLSFADNLELDEKALQNYRSRTITSVASSGAYDDGTGRYRSFDEEISVTDHAKKVISRSMKKFLLKYGVNIRINGQGFIDKKHSTVGNKVRLLFLANRPTVDGGKLDLKKSGDYIIYGCRHVLSVGRYDVHLQCLKMKNFIDDSVLKG